MKIDDIKRELEQVDIEITDVDGVPTYCTFILPNGDKMTMWEWFEKKFYEFQEDIIFSLGLTAVLDNYTPNIDVEKTVRELQYGKGANDL